MTSPAESLLGHLGHWNARGSAASGMSKREFFAGLALLGIVGSEHPKIGEDNPDYWTRRKRKRAAETAVEYADALIKALNKEDEA